MAEWKKRYPSQAKGFFSTTEGRRVQFFVDKECILCSACVTHAPLCFKESDDATHDLVYKQPESEEELAACYEAQAACPVNAIGDDCPEDAPDVEE